MNIERRFFAAILARPRRKAVEYRAMSPFWKQRLAGLGSRPFKLRLLNGMLPPVPEAVIVVNHLVRDYRNRQFSLQLGRILRVQHWDRDREVPLARSTPRRGPEKSGRKGQRGDGRTKTP